MEKIIERLVAPEFRNILMAGPIVEFSLPKTEEQSAQIRERFAEFDRMMEEMKRCRVKDGVVEKV